MLRFLADSFDVPFVDSERLEKQPPTKEFLWSYPVCPLLRHGLLPVQTQDEAFAPDRQSHRGARRPLSTEYLHAMNARRLAN
jgi:hypothetical protein